VDGRHVNGIGIELNVDYAACSPGSGGEVLFAGAAVDVPRLGPARTFDAVVASFQEAIAPRPAGQEARPLTVAMRTGPGGPGVLTFARTCARHPDRPQLAALGIRPSGSDRQRREPVGHRRVGLRRAAGTADLVYSPAICGAGVIVDGSCCGCGGFSGEFGHMPPTRRGLCAVAGVAAGDDRRAGGPAAADGGSEDEVRDRHSTSSSG